MSCMHSHPTEVNGSCLSPDHKFNQSVIMVRYDHGVVPHVPESPSPGMLFQTLEYIKGACGPLQLSPHMKDSHALPSWDMRLTVTVHFCRSPVEWQPNETE